MASFLSLMVNPNRSLKHSQQPLQRSLAAAAATPLTRLQLPKAVRHRQLHHRQRAPQAAAAAAVAQPAAPVKAYQQVLQIR